MENSVEMMHVETHAVYVIHVIHVMLLDNVMQTHLIVTESNVVLILVKILAENATHVIRVMHQGNA